MNNIENVLKTMHSPKINANGKDNLFSLIYDDMIIADQNVERVFVYYECGYGNLAEIVGACSNICIFSSIDKAKHRVVEAIKLYAGTGNNNALYYGCDKFVVDADLLDYAKITVNKDGKITDEQIAILLECTLKRANICLIPLFAGEQNNWDEFITINVNEIEIE